jgi:hypothetical protein
MTPSNWQERDAKLAAADERQVTTFHLPPTFHTQTLNPETPNLETPTPSKTNLSILKHLQQKLRAAVDALKQQRYKHTEHQTLNLNPPPHPLNSLSSSSTTTALTATSFLC